MGGVKVVHLSLALCGLLSAAVPAFGENTDWKLAPPIDTTTGAATTTGATGAAPELKPTATVPDAAATVDKRPRATTAQAPDKKKNKRYGKTAFEMARYHWLDRAAAADPSIVAAICENRKGAVELARNPRIAEIADVDHYLCRRITKWKNAAWILAENPQVGHVISLDPEGIYRAIRRNPKIARRLAENPTFADMIDTNPDLGSYIAHHL